MQRGDDGLGRTRDACNELGDVGNLIAGQRERLDVRACDETAPCAHEDKGFDLFISSATF